jgi:hypothetical protein
MTYDYALASARSEATAYAIAASSARRDADQADAAARRAPGYAAPTGAQLHVVSNSNESLRQRLADAQDEISALREMLVQAEADRDIALDFILKNNIRHKRAA